MNPYISLPWFIASIIFAISFGFSVTIIILNNLPGTFSDAITALDKCEKSLPRDQNCIITAIPQKQDNSLE